MPLGVHSPTIYFGKVPWDKDVKVKKRSLKTLLLIYIEFIDLRIDTYLQSLALHAFSCTVLFIKALTNGFLRGSVLLSENHFSHKTSLEMYIIKNLVE